MACAWRNTACSSTRAKPSGTSVTTRGPIAQGSKMRSAGFATPDTSNHRRLRQQAFFQRLDLDRQIAREDAALREAAGGEPQPGLGGARPHVAQFAALVEAPDRADLVGYLAAEKGA